MKKRLEAVPDGEYYYPEARFIDQTPEVAMLHNFVSRLSFYFPEFMWSTSDSIDPNVKGITVRWRRKARPINNPYSKKELGR